MFYLVVQGTVCLIAIILWLMIFMISKMLRVDMVELTYVIFKQSILIFFLCVLLLQ